MDPNILIDNLRVLNWNANGIARQRSTFINFLSRYNIDIACLSETHLHRAETLNIPGYAVYRSDRIADAASGGVTIVIKCSIKCNQLPQITTTSLEQTGISIQRHASTKFNIFSVYKQPNKRLQGFHLNKIFHNGTPTIILGDLNCKNTIWGCRTSNSSGILLEELSSSLAFQIDCPHEFTYIPYQENRLPDILDIALLKNFNLPAQQQIVHELDSDHLPVIVTFTSINTYQSKRKSLSKVQLIGKNLKCCAQAKFAPLKRSEHLKI